MDLTRRHRRSSLRELVLGVVYVLDEADVTTGGDAGMQHAPDLVPRAPQSARSGLRGVDLRAEGAVRHTLGTRALGGDTGESGPSGEISRRWVRE